MPPLGRGVLLGEKVAHHRLLILSAEHGDERQRQGAARSRLRAEAPRLRQEERPAQQEEAAQSSALIVAITLRDNHEWRTAHHITGQKVNGMNDNDF